jgi:hypothetical protein
VLTARVLQTMAEHTDRGIKVSNIRRHRKIDGHIACVMAH